ncbi:MAG: sigma-70 family RNA polymerase sigma factor [Bacteroidota bacterium]|nr:sigma-70 family RNA polymerase sigma factor [Bacteroidota bacterium]
MISAASVHNEASRYARDGERKNDEVLITLFQSGDEDAFRILVERYQERVRNLIYSILNRSDVVDDLAQEIFIRVYEALPKFRFESSFYTWLYRVAVNKVRDEMRRKKVKRFFSLQKLMDDADAELTAKMSVAPEDHSMAEIMNDALNALPEKFRMPVVLKDVDGLSYDEIAEVLECGIGTVKSRLSRGRAMLRKRLKPLLV